MDSIKKANTIDSVYLDRRVEMADTAHIRVLNAFHHVKMFKSDLQGKSDSAFYSNSDSTIHLYVHPMIWTQGSQLSGDTVTLQMKNKKLNNMELFPNAFIVNLEKKDSVHFNQVAGKKMRGFFKDSKLTTMFVDGNSETIYFAHDSTGKVTEMQRSLSSRIRIYFKDNKAQRIIFMSKPEHRYGPLEKFSEEDKLLKGFIWKPKDRPVSKEAIIHAPDNYPTRPTKTTAKNTGKKQTGKKGATKKGQKPGVKPGIPPVPAAKASIDSLKKQPAKDIDSLRKLQDTTKKSLDTGKKLKDTTTVKKSAKQ